MKLKPVIGDRKKLKHQLASGIKQLNNGEGTNMAAFIRRLKKKYGHKSRNRM